MTVLHTDIDPYCCAVLRKNFPHDEVLEKDIREIQPEDVAGYEQVHWFAGIGGFGLACRWSSWIGSLWTGGFPCTDISVAGRGAGLAGKQSGLWWEWLRLIRACRPARLLIENVPALRTRGFDDVADALEGDDYAVRPLVVGARHVGAPHKRDRIWIVADSKRDGRGAWSGESGDESGAGIGRGEFAGSGQLHWPARPGQRQHEWEAPRLVEFGVGSAVDGLPVRLARFGNKQALRALGNAIVPQVAAAILRAWQQAERLNA